MSVQTSQYLIIGVKRPFQMGDGTYDSLEDFMPNTFKSEVQNHKGLCVLYDGMNGRYILYGRMIAKSAVHEMLDGPFSFTDIEPETRDLVHALLDTHFPEIKATKDEIAYWFVTEYS